MNDEYNSDSTVIYTPDKLKLTSRTEEKLTYMPNALPSGDSLSAGKNYSFKYKTTVTMTVN